MEYKKIIANVRKLEFMPDESTADAMVKAVLGHLARQMEERSARAFARDLPEQINYNVLLGHQTHPFSISLERVARNLKHQFRITSEQATSLITSVLRQAKTGVPNGRVHCWAEGLPHEWVELIENM
jgi:uncharacterized protein (DUF2267 family)